MTWLYTGDIEDISTPGALRLFPQCMCTGTMKNRQLNHPERLACLNVTPGGISMSCRFNVLENFFGS